jgi:hypothetical protein
VLQSFVDVSKDDYLKATIVFYQLNDTRPLAELYCWTDRRSCQHFDTSVQVVWPRFTGLCAVHSWPSQYPAEKFFRMSLLLAAHALARLGNVTLSQRGGLKTKGRSGAIASPTPRERLANQLGEQTLQPLISQRANVLAVLRGSPARLSRWCSSAGGALRRSHVKFHMQSRARSGIHERIQAELTDLGVQERVEPGLSHAQTSGCPSLSQSASPNKLFLQTREAS